MLKLIPHVLFAFIIHNYDYIYQDPIYIFKKTIPIKLRFHFDNKTLIFFFSPKIKILIFSLYIKYIKNICFYVYIIDDSIVKLL